MMEGSVLTAADIAIIVVYFAFVLFVGLWTSRQNRGSAGGYFLAGESMSWMPVGASLFASNIGSIHFIGLASSGAASGIAAGVFVLNAIFVLLLLGYLFLPVYFSAGVYTMPEYLLLRFGGRRIQVSMALFSIIVYIFTKISADLYAGALFIEQALKWDLYFSLLLILGIASLLTITGGLTAVIWTDFIQCFIMLSGAIILMVLSFAKVGGFAAMVEKYPRAIPNTTLVDNTTQCGYPREDYMHFFHAYDADDIPGPGIIGITINSIWYWCSDQVIVQRVLAAKSYDHSKAATIFCGFLKLLPLFLLIFPGMIARILYTDTVGCADPAVCLETCGSETSCTNIAYSSLIIGLMPAGVRGLMLASMISALISSLTSIFNSSSTIFALDIWSCFRKKASELEVIIVGRIFIVILVAVSILWIPIIKASQGGDLFVYIQVISSFTQPPICAVFILAIFWERLNEKGAFFSLVFGMAVGMIRFAIEYYQTMPHCTDNLPDPRPDMIKNFHFLYFSTFLFVFTIVCAVSISLLTQPIDPRCLVRLTWWTRHSKEPRLNMDMVTATADPVPMIAMVEVKNDISDHSENEDEGEVDSDMPAMIGKINKLKSKVYQEPPNNNMQIKMENVEKMEVVTADPLPYWKKSLYWICCFEKGNSIDLQQKQVTKQIARSIEESPRWKMSSMILSLILIGINAFFLIYFF